MLRKKTTLNVSKKRSVAQFFNRLTEVFERKFDGFPATLEGTNTDQLDNNDTVDADVGAVIDAITDEILAAERSTNQCPDQPVDTAGTGDSVTESLTSVEDSAWDPFREWQASLSVNYFTRVLLDGMPLVQSDDYTTTSEGTVVLIEGLGYEDAVVVGSYVVA